MKISQLIAQLENLKFVHGDLEMSLYDMDMGYVYRLQEHHILFLEESNSIQIEVTDWKDETL